MKKFILVLLILLLTGCGKEENVNKDLPVNPNALENEVNENSQDNVNSEIDKEVSSQDKDTSSNETSQSASGKDTSSNQVSQSTSSKDTSANQASQDTSSKDTSSSQVTPSTPSNPSQPSSNITYSSEDKLVINSIEEVNQNVDDLLKQEKTEDTKSKLKGVFITLVDFVFYDGEIKGVTFNELTEEGKAKVLKLINTIDEKIENYFPGYKETISSKANQAFTKASEIIKNGANNIKDFAKDKLGEKYYQEIIDAKDELVLYTKNAFSLLGDFSSSLFNDIKDKLSNWYENFKNNN